MIIQRGENHSPKWQRGEKMKIALPVDEKNENSRICVSYGRAPYYMIFDSDSAKVEFVQNTAADSAGGAGIKAAQLLVNHKVNILITERCGQNAADVLIAGNIKIYRATKALVMDNLKAFLQGELEELSDIHPGYHGHKN